MAHPEAASLDDIEVQLSPKHGSGSPVLTTHELRRAHKGIETNAQTIQSRIRFFQREEEKIWRDLEEVRRQASKIEEGRTRSLEKRLAVKAITQIKDQSLAENRLRALKQRHEISTSKKQTTIVVQHERRVAGDQQRRESEEVLRQKRLEEAQQRLDKTEKVVSKQREVLEAKLRINKERSERVSRIREEQELTRQEAERGVRHVESRLPELEAQEIACLQRLQNSRVVSQTVLQELEASLGAQSAVTSMLRAKQQRSTALLTENVGLAG